MQMEPPGKKCRQKKRCELLSLFIDTRGLICILGAGQNADGVSREEMSARKRCGLLSLFIDIRRLSCILGAGQNADGVSREEMSPGRDVGFFFSLLPEDSYAFWEQAKMQMESPGEKCSARKRRGLLSLFMDTRGLIRILGAGQNADGVSREEMSPGKDVGCCLSLLISDDSAAFWEQAKMQMESPGKKCRPGKDVGCYLSLLISDDSSAFWERAKMQMESPGKKCRPGRDVGCYLSLLISDDSSAFWERAKVQMESPGTKCRPGRDVGCCLSLFISDDSSAFWEQAKMQMESPRKKCRQEEMWAAVSLYWYQTTHLHFGSGPKCRWSLSGRNVARKRCGLLSLFIDTRGFIRILGAGQNADGVCRDEMSPRRDVGSFFSLLIPDDSSAFWERAKMQMESPGEKCRPGRDVGCCLSLLISDDSYAFWEQAKMQMESPGKKCRQEKMWAAVFLYWYQKTHTHFGSGPKCRWSFPGRNVDQEEMWAAVSLYWYQRTHTHFGSRPKCRWSPPGNVARKRCGLLSLFIDIRRLICILGAGQNADGVSRDEMSPGKDVGCCLSLLISDDSSAFWEQAKMQMESPGKKCRQEKMWAAVSLYWYQTTQLHFGSRSKCRWSLPGRNVARKRCGLLSLFIDSRFPSCKLWR